MEVDEGGKGLDGRRSRADPVLRVGQETLAHLDEQLAEEALFALEVAVDGPAEIPTAPPISSRVTTR